MSQLKFTTGFEKVAEPFTLTLPEEALHQKPKKGEKLTPAEMKRLETLFSESGSVAPGSSAHKLIMKAHRVGGPQLLAQSYSKSQSSGK